jgi:Carboxypeptidase regulatory-like domain
MVFGRVLETDGSPLHRVAWGWISFVDRSGKRWNADCRQGAYAVVGLAAGPYTVSARAEACRPVEESFELRADRPQVEKDFRLPRCAVLRIRVDTPEGKPLFAEVDHDFRWEIVPVATKDPPDRHVYEVVGSLNNPFGVGHFWPSAPGGEALPPDCIGVVHVDADLPVFVSLVFCHAVLQTRRADPGAEEVTFVLSLRDVLMSLGSLRAQIIEAANSAPIEGADLRLDGGPMGGGSARSAEDGLAMIQGARPGRFQLQVRKDGYEHVARTVDVEPGQETDLGMIALARGVIARIRVVDGLGNPTSASFRIGNLSRSGGRVEIDDLGGASSKADGTLELSNLGRKLYVLRTTNHDAGYDGDQPVSSWVSGCVLLDTSAGEVRDMEIRLEPAVGLAIRVEGGAADGLRFAVLDSGGLPLVRDRFYGSAPRPLRLPAGSYRVELRDKDDNVLGGRDVKLASEPVELAIGR